MRQEAAYALGKTRSKSAVAPLIERLNLDKRDGVRGAAAIALGQIGDEAAVVSLAQVLGPQLDAPNSSKARKNQKSENVFVLRAAARSLGQIASRGERESACLASPGTTTTGTCLDCVLDAAHWPSSVDTST